MICVAQNSLLPWMQHIINTLHKIHHMESFNDFHNFFNSFLFFYFHYASVNINLYHEYTFHHYAVYNMNFIMYMDPIILHPTSLKYFILYL